MMIFKKFSMKSKNTKMINSKIIIRMNKYLKKINCKKYKIFKKMKKVMKKFMMKLMNNE